MKSINDCYENASSKFYSTLCRNTLGTKLASLGFVMTTDNEFDCTIKDMNLNIQLEFDYASDKIIIHGYFANSHFKSSIFFDSDNITIETSIEYLLENLFFKHIGVEYKN